MNQEKIQQVAKEKLADISEHPGSILYSSHETLRPNNVYLLGFNPGGSGGRSLSISIDEILTSTSNAYLDESWKNGSGSWESGQAPLQERICWLLSQLGFNPREVCASNLIYLQSREAKDISYSLAEICWPVHEEILRIVRPSLIITFGNSDRSPYRYMHSMLGGEEEYIPSGHGNWNLKGFHSIINGNKVYIAGLPHLSRYDPQGKSHVIDWLSKHVQSEA